MGGDLLAASISKARCRRTDSVFGFFPDLRRLCSGDCIALVDATDIEDWEELE